MDDSSTEVIPVAEEEVVLSKRRVETGAVQVRISVDTHENWIRETLNHQNVEIERKPIQRQVETPPAIREQGDVLIIPILEEVLVVEKRLMLTEEIHVRKRVRQEQVEQPVTLRRQRVSVRRVAKPAEPKP